MPEKPVYRGLGCGYFQNILIGLDQFIGTIFGIPADITISGWVGYRYPGSWMEKFMGIRNISLIHDFELSL